MSTHIYVLLWIWAEIRAVSKDEIFPSLHFPWFRNHSYWEMIGKTNSIFSYIVNVQEKFKYILSSLCRSENRVVFHVEKSKSDIYRCHCMINDWSRLPILISMFILVQPSLMYNEIKLLAFLFNDIYINCLILVCWLKVKIICFFLFQWSAFPPLPLYSL